MDIKHDGLGKVDPLYAGESNMARGKNTLVQIRSTLHLQRLLILQLVPSP